MCDHNCGASLQGLDLDAVGRSHGAAAQEQIRQAVRQHEKKGLVIFQAGAEGDTQCRLADPEGFLLSNDIISDIFAALSPS